MMNLMKKTNKKKGGDNGKRKPIIDDLGKWCNCTLPKLVSNMGIGPGSAYCLKCKCNWYN